MRRSPRATAAWFAVAALALVTARTVAADLASLHAQARRSGPLVTIIVARRDLALGHVVTAGDVVGRRVFAADRPPGSFSSAPALAGRTVAVPVVAGLPIVRAALVDPRSGRGLVRPGQRGVWIPLDRDVGRPQPGEVVDVLATFPGSDDPTLTVAHGAIVLESTGEGGGDPDGDRGAPAGGVALLVDEADAARVAYALANGTVALAVAPVESACCQSPATRR